MDNQMRGLLENFIQDVTNDANDNAYELFNIMQSLGMELEEIKGWTSAVLDQVRSVWHTVIEEAKSTRQSVISSIEELLKDSEKLCKCLKIPMPMYGSEDLPLLQHKQDIRKHVNELKQIKEARTTQMEMLKKREAKLCQCLGREPSMPSLSVLTSTELDKFAKVIEKMELELFEREDQYMTIKEKIIELATELGVKASLDMEKNILCPDAPLPIMSDENVKWVNDYYKSLQNQREEISNEITNIKEKLNTLWGMLQEDLKMCNDFLEIHTGTSLKNLAVWRQELARCENLKKANIQKFVMDLREKIRDLWKKCQFTEDQRNEFQHFHCDVYTEDLLTLHDIEIEKLERYYTNNKDLFQLLEKFGEGWTKLLDMEVGKSDPSRLKNRGGALLREEKEWNALRKRLPQYEARLLELADAYEARHKTPFLSWGETVEQVVAKTRAAHYRDLEVKLSARKQQQQQQRDATTTSAGFGASRLKSASSVSRLNVLFPRTPLTPGAKRKLEQNFASAEKKSKVEAPESNKKSTLKAPKIRLNNYPILKQKHNLRKRLSQDRQDRLKKIMKIDSLLNKSRSMSSKSHISINQPDEDYQIFKSEVSSKEKCRSTIFQSAQLAPTAEALDEKF